MRLRQELLNLPRRMNVVGHDEALTVIDHPVEQCDSFVDFLELLT